MAFVLGLFPARPHIAHQPVIPVENLHALAPPIRPAQEAAEQWSRVPSDDTRPPVAEASPATAEMRAAGNRPTGTSPVVVGGIEDPAGINVKHRLEALQAGARFLGFFAAKKSGSSIFGSHP